MLNLCSSQTQTMDWDGNTWTAGSYSNSYNIDPNNPGNDFSLSITGSTNLIESATQPNNNKTNNQGGLVPAQNNLYFRVNSFTTNNSSEFIRVSMGFNYAGGVSNVSFTIFDVDSQNGGGGFYQDLITNIYSVSTTGITNAATLVGSVGNTILNSGTLTASAAGIATTANSSGNANVTLTFGNVSNINEIVFFYRPGPAHNDPTGQSISIHDITYTVIPEPGALISFALLAVGMFFLRKRKVS